MKKNISIIIGIITICFTTLYSCDDELDFIPQDTLTDKGITFSKNEMEMYANQYYPSLPGHLSWWAWTSDGPTDNNVPAGFGSNGLIYGTQTVPSSGGGWGWGSIRSTNFFLNNYKKSQASIADQNKYVGEVLFFKSMYYFNMMKTFGDLPWLSNTLNVDSEELYGERISRSIIADSILKLLDESIAKLPTKTQTETGRIHKDVARLFKARIALYEGTWEKYHQGTPFAGDGRDVNRFFTQARDAAEAVMNSGYSLYSEYSDPLIPDGFSYWRLFSTPSNEITGISEVLLARRYDSELGLVFWGQQIRTSGGPSGQGISKSLVDAYLCSDGLPTSLSPLYLGDDTLEDLVTDRDPRLKMTVSTPGVPIKIFNGNVDSYQLPFLSLNPWPNTTGYQIYKWLNPFIAPEDASGNNTSTAVPIFRYAEALLVAAEAHEELGTCTQEVLDRTINLLRTRAGVAALNASVGFSDPNWDFPNLSPLLNEIRRERRVELAFEGFRFDDLFRWAASHLISEPRLGSKVEQWRNRPFSPEYDVDAAPVNSEGYISPYFNIIGEGNLEFDPTKNYLYPLPIDQLTLNPNLTQNPGY